MSLTHSITVSHNQLHSINTMLYSDSRLVATWHDCVQLQHAEACLIMANSRSNDPDSEDASNIMRIVSVKNYCESTRIIVQLIRHSNKVVNIAEIAVSGLSMFD